MRILVLGGTAFVGRAITADALQAGHEVTLFGRGRTGSDLFPQAPRLVGDRDADDHAALGRGGWDAVVDVSGYVPRHVAGAMSALGDRVGRYLFISSHAVYAPGAPAWAGEEAPRRRANRETEVLDGDTYGECKVACEDDVLSRYGDRATIVRPGKVAGPYDTSDALTYWVRRAARGGPVALPADPGQPVQVVDARDVARLVTLLLEQDLPGAYNAVGPSTTMHDLIHTCADAAGTRVEVVPVPPDSAGFLFPLLKADPTSQQRSAATARRVGMPETPLRTTAADTLQWDRDRGEPPMTRGFTAAREAALLAEAGR